MIEVVPLRVIRAQLVCVDRHETAVALQLVFGEKTQSRGLARAGLADGV